MSADHIMDVGSKMDLVDAPNATAIEAIRRGMLFEAIVASMETKVDAILVDTGTTLDTLVKDIPTNSELNLRTLLAADYATAASITSQATEIGKLANLSANNSRYIATLANMAVTAWNTAAAHEVFVVTGCARLRMWVTCTTLLASTGSGATLTFGVAGAPDAFIAATIETEIDSGDLWFDATPTTMYGAFTGAVMDYVVNGIDVGYTIITEPLISGAMVFHCVWEPLSAGATVAIGAGGAF
jgi:hypothetical protein